MRLNVLAPKRRRPKVTHSPFLADPISLIPSKKCQNSGSKMTNDRKGPSKKYVTQFETNFTPSPCHTLSTVSGPPKVRSPG